MILFLVVGLVFALAGLLIVYLAIYYRLHGRPHEGAVYAIEEYVSIQREDGVDRKQVLYRPIFKYKFCNSIYYFSGGGSNVINRKIGEKINVYILISKGPEYCKAEISFSVWFGLIFILIGLLSIILFFFKGDFYISPMSLFFIAMVLISILTVLAKILKTNQNIFDQFLKNSQMIPEEDLENLNLMKTQEELEQFLSYRNKLGLYFTASTTLLFFGLSFFLWNEKLSEGFKINIIKIISMFDFNALLNSMQSNHVFLGFTIFFLFGLIAFMSSLQLYLKTYNK